MKRTLIAVTLAILGFGVHCPPREPDARHNAEFGLAEGAGSDRRATAIRAEAVNDHLRAGHGRSDARVSNRRVRDIGRTQAARNPRL